MTCAKTNSDLRKEWPLTTRETGLVEIICPHGVGHPSKVLTPPKLWKDWMNVHGCCGICCDTAAFALAEIAHNNKS